MANTAKPAAKPAKPAPSGLCEGVREELERLGVSVDPFTGRKLTRADLPKN